MPRIDPLQLLKCLSVLLTPEGGILSRDEVPRLVNLMTKFSKKLVSKCVYVLILKSTETDLVDMFMAEGGWTLIQAWLQDAVQTGNWDLVREILSLLLVTPVDVERLKLNILPKLIKSLSRREELVGVAQLSTQLVQQWLAIVKGSSNVGISQTKPQVPSEKVEVPQTELANNSISSETPNGSVDVPDKKMSPSIEGAQEDDNTDAIKTDSFYKPSVKDGKLVIRKLAPSVEEPHEQEISTKTEDAEVEQEPSKDEQKKIEAKDKSKSKSSSKSSSHSKDRDRDKDKRRSSSSKSSSVSGKSKNSSSSSKRDKDRKERDKDKDKHKSSSNSSKSNSTKDRRDSKDKEKQAEKDKDTLDKIKPKTIEKLGRIPKKSSSSSTDNKSKELKEKELREKEIKEKEINETKKKSFSVGIRKDSEERPKTVKVFNSKMRSTGLEEEIKPAPPRPTKKPTPSVQLPTIPAKRPSPPRDHRDPIVPPEKKLKVDKIDVPERPGAIKLIPPKPKRVRWEAGETYQLPIHWQETVFLLC